MSLTKSMILALLWAACVPVSAETPKSLTLRLLLAHVPA